MVSSTYMLEYIIPHLDYLLNILGVESNMVPPLLILDVYGNNTSSSSLWSPWWTIGILRVTSLHSNMADFSITGILVA